MTQDHVPDNRWLTPKPLFKTRHFSKKNESHQNAGKNNRNQHRGNDGFI